MTRHRLNVFLLPEHALRLDELALLKGLSKSSIVADALVHLLARESGVHAEASIVQRLKRIHQQLEKLEHEQTVSREAFALFIRTFLAVTPSVPEAKHEAARASGRARFEQFLQQLARHLQRGDSLMRDLGEVLYPGAKEFSMGNDPAAGCQEER